jgi:superfamily I DNA and RNA helicase
MTSGERRLALRLEDKLDRDYLCWYDVAVGNNPRHPDFIVLHPSLGFLILEVKDWKLETILELSRDSAVIHTQRGRVVEPNPIMQARGYALEVNKLLQRDAQLRHPEDHHRSGKLIMPWGWGVVLANITRRQFEQAELETYIPANSVICKDEIGESVEPDKFQKALADMFLMPFPCLLSLPQIERVRWSLFPELRIPEQGNMFDVKITKQDEIADVPDIIRIMDLQQEQLARSLGDGHRVIHGVAGSGKTMILGYRCLALARKYSKPILVLCYNKTLAARLEQLVAGHGVADKVTVQHFHGWCTKQLDAYAVPRPNLKGQPFYDALVEAVISGVESKSIPRAQYAAVLIDEGHDFRPEWLKLISGMVDPETNSLLLLYDDAQNIYDAGNKRKFSFASIGIQAQGRSTILRLNYRNTFEVLATAKAFAQDIISEQTSDDDHVPLIAPESAGRRGPLPELVLCRSIWEEARVIAQRIRAAIGDGGAPDDFAVLCPTNNIAGTVAKELGKLQVPFVLASDKNKREIFGGQPSVKVLTIHSSKGLEFATVFMPGVCEIASYAPASDQTQESAAKLLYVGMTRALRRLVLLHHREGTIPTQLGAAINQVRERLEAA